MKIVVNKCYGGFDLSREARDMYKYRAGVKDFHPFDLDRTDPILIQVVEELGKDANGRFSDLRIVEIPDDIVWFIDDHDGRETICEQHMRW